MISNIKIRVKVFSLIPNDIIKDNEISCDYLAFKSSFDVDSYIGNSFNFESFLKNDFSAFTGSQLADTSVEDNERFTVYVYPEHKSMISYLEKNAFIDFYSDNKKSISLSLPDGAVLNIKNRESEALEVELITNNIVNRYGN